MSTDADWKQQLDDCFNASPLYRDGRGYVWQRMRNGVWRSTDGLRTFKPSPPGSAPEEALPSRWGPFTRITELPVLPRAADSWDETDDALIEAGWGLIANAWDCAGREKFADWIDSASAWRERYHARLDRLRKAAS